jgi:hypothetical protein
MVRTSPLPVIALALVVVVAATGVASAGNYPDPAEVEDVTISDPGQPLPVNSPHTVNVSLEIGSLGDEDRLNNDEVAISIFAHKKENGTVTKIPLGDKRLTVDPNSTVTFSQTIHPDFKSLEPGTYKYVVRAHNDVSDNVTVTLSGESSDTRDVNGDVDDDGAVEDVDGDGEVTIRDVALFLDTFDSERDGDRFDHTGDGDVTIRDVATLLDELI